MDLYLDKPLRKTAAFVARLSEETNNWPQEITSELYKLLPYLSDYEVHVEIERTDPQRGFGFGYADVSNPTERPEVEHGAAGLPHIRIPIVIQDRALKSLATFLDGEAVRPLNEDRIREALFQPATFDLSNTKPQDPSLVADMMPPQRSGFGYGEVKTASVGRTQKEMEREATRRALDEMSYKTPHGALVRKIDKGHSIMAPIVGAGVGAKHGYERAGAYGALSGAALGATLAVGVSEIGSRVGNRLGEIISKKLPEKYIDPAFKKSYQKHLKSLEKEKRASLLLAIAPTIKQAEVDRFVEKIASSPELIAGFRQSGIAPVLVQFQQEKRASARDHLMAVAEGIEPSVVTLQKLPGGDFLVKSANTDAFAGGQQAQGQVVPQEEAAQAIGSENAQAMLPGQAVTVTADPVAMASQKPQSRAKVVEEFGQYKVQDMLGNSLVGHVFPQSLSWDGEFSEQPIAVFTNGSAYAVQDSVAGEFVGKGTNLPSDSPRGDGIFYCIDGGEARCTGPVTIGSSMAGPDGMPKYQGTDLMGNQLLISFMEGLKTPQMISDSEFALPGHWKFMRLNNQTKLIPDPAQMNKTAAVHSLRDTVTLFWNGAYQLEGGAGLSKVARDLRYDMDPVHAEFMLGVLGVDGITAKQKVAEARRKGAVKLAGVKTITPLSERYLEATKTAAATLASLGDLRVDLIKEAAGLPDAGTVDNVLSLNFINAENLPTFIGYLPDLEATGEQLAEMLLYAQLGLREIPEEECERAMKNVEAVVQRLKAIAHAEA